MKTHALAWYGLIMKQADYPWREVYVVTMSRPDEKTLVLRLPEESAADALARAKSLRPSCSITSVDPKE